MARVLVVEDEPNIAGIIVFKLEREGHAVTRAAGMAEAEAALAAAEPPDLVLLDTSLEDGDAFELLGRLPPGLRVIALTEFRDEVAPGRALELGAARAVAKPFKPTVLARVVGEVLAAAPG